MKLATDIKRVLTVTALLFVTGQLTAQSMYEENPMDVAVIKFGTDSLTEIYSQEVDEQTKITGLQTAMNTCLTQIKKYNKEYSNYLSNVTPFIKNVNLVRNLYAQGADLIRNTLMLTRMIDKKPQGLATSVSLSNIYVELAVEFYKTYSTFKDVVAKGGPDNKLTAKERVEMLWLLSDNIRELNVKIKNITYLVAITEWKDVWLFYTEGLVSRNAGAVAHDALERWKNVYQANATLMGLYK